MRPLSATALALVLLGACERSITAPTQSLLVTVVITPAVIRSGDSAVVLVVVSNRTPESQTYEIDGCSPSLAITTPAGIDLTFPTSCFNSETLVTVPAGEQRVYVSYWIADVPSTSSERPGQPLPPGTYVVRAAAIQSDVAEVVPLSVQIMP